MRNPQKRFSRTQKSYIQSISSPVGGLNARDPLADMPTKDAIVLDNFYCTPYDVGVRLGYSAQGTGFADQVNTLASYSPSLSASAKLFAWSADKIYNITNAGAIGSPVISGNTNSIFQTMNFGTSAGAFLFAVNGSDLPLIYNGAVWSNAFSTAFITTVTSVTSVGTLATVTMANPHNLKTGMSVILAGFTPAGYNGTYVITVTGLSTFTYVLAGALGVTSVTGTVTPTVNAAITGVNPALFNQVAVCKSRLWFVEKESLRAWYLPVLSIGGAASQLDFSALFNQGGYLVAMCDWSLDAGQGLDDYVAFVSSRGQVAIYQGTDPASASTWGLVGVFDLGAPIGQRCLTKYAGDVLYISQDGLVPLGKALMSTRTNQRLALTDKIQQLISNYTTLYGSSFGWQTVLFPAENMVVLNSPPVGTSSKQFVMNNISGAWSTFSGMLAYCWVLHQDRLYFGSTNMVGKAWDTYADNGANINFEAQTSFNYFNQASQLKAVKMARPVISTDGSPAILFGTNTDFDMSIPTGVPSFSPLVSGVWDSGLWDVAVWGGDPIVKRDWQTASGIGYCISAHMVGQISGSQLSWSSVDFMLQDGGMV